MTIKNYLTPLVKRKKILGRGVGSGRGKTCGRGTKGQGSRKSGNVRLGFEGGQTPVFRRFPKRGFKSNKENFDIVNIEEFEKNQNIKDGQRIVLNFEGKKIKVLGKGALNKKLFVEAFFFSKSSQEKIEKAGGSFKLLG
jgi:large subunit ribosomal protein L15